MTNNKLTDKLEAERIKDIAEGAPIVAGEAQAMAVAIQECCKASPVAWTDAEEMRDIEKHGCAYIFKIDPTNQFIDPRRQIMLYAVPQQVVTLPNGAEELYSIANHIEGSKGGLPDEWQGWIDDIERELRRISAVFLNGAINAN